MKRPKQTAIRFLPDRDYLIPSHPATSRWVSRFVFLLAPYRAAATDLLRERGRLLGSEELEDIELRDVPATKLEMDALLASVQTYQNGRIPAPVVAPVTF